MTDEEKGTGLFAVIVASMGLAMGIMLGMAIASSEQKKEPAKEQAPRVVMTEADKAWIDTQIGWELDRQGLKVFVINTLVPDKEANVLRHVKVGVIVAASKEEAETILKERK
jgi:hypothetical protein